MAAGLAGAAALAGPAAGAWSSAERVTPAGESARFPSVAANARGDAVAAWTIRRNGRTVIQAAIRRRGGAWERPRTLTGAGRAALDPDVAINDRGDLLVAFRRVVRTRTVQTLRGPKRQAVYVVHARRRTVVGRGWGPVQRLSSGRQKSGAPEGALDAAGRAVVTWHWGTGTRPGDPGFVSQVQAATAGARRRFGPPRRLSRRPGCPDAVGLPVLAVGVAGHAVIWWECRLGGRSVAVDYALKTAGGTAFGSDRRLPGRGRVQPEPDGTVARDGSVVLVLLRGAPNRRGAVLQYAARQGSRGALGPPRSLAGGARGVDLGVAGTAAGNALAAWIGPRGSGGRGPVQVAARGPGAPAFGPRERVGPAERTADAEIAQNAAGAAAAVWLEGPERGARLLAANRTDAARPWRGPAAVSASGALERGNGGPALAIDGTGRALAYWARASGGGSVIERAEYRPDAT